MTIGRIRKDIEAAGFNLTTEMFNSMTYWELRRFRRKALRINKLTSDLRRMVERNRKPAPKQSAVKKPADASQLTTEPAPKK